MPSTVLSEIGNKQLTSRW